MGHVEEVELRGPSDNEEVAGDGDAVGFRVEVLAAGQRDIANDVEGRRQHFADEFNRTVPVAIRSAARSAVAVMTGARLRNHRRYRRGAPRELRQCSGSVQFNCGQCVHHQRAAVIRDLRGA